MRATADVARASPLLFAGTCAGASLASLFRGAGPIAMLLGATIGAAIAWSARAAFPRSNLSARELIERFAPWTALAFFLPVFTLAAAPGIDMAMHAALARSLAHGAHDLSPAWPGISPAVYPRGFSALMALLSLAGPLGFARASLVASAVAMALYQAGATRLFAAVGANRPATLGALAALLSRTPQSWFSWGGDPTALALGLGFFAAAIALARDSPLLLWRPALAASLLLAGAGAVHPIGSLAAALVLVALLLPSFAFARSRASIPALVSLAALGLVLSAIAGFGPLLSTRELDWMIGYSRGTEAIVHGPPWQFAWRIWLALGPTLGDPWTISAALGAAFLLIRAYRSGEAGDASLVAISLAAVLGLGALLAMGPYVPHIGAYLYPSRFAPLLALAMAPIFDRSLSRIAAAVPKIATVLTIGLLIAAIPVHIRAYQRTEPLASFKDLRAIDCLAARTSEDAVIEGANGDAAQWIPALTGRRVTDPHKHCSLFDEIDLAIAPLHPGYRFRGERARYGESLPALENGAAPLCAEGDARVWPLSPAAR